MAELHPGSIVYGKTEANTHEVIREIGRGAFGRVYEVRDRSSGISFAVKTIDATAMLDTTERRALHNEGQLSLDINHPNVVQVFYFHNGEQYSDLPPYTLMEYVAGGNNLQKVIDSRKPRSFFSLQELMNIYTQLALGMQAINKRLVHRDIKPDNILVQNGVYKISDFGLSKVVGVATRSETFKGINHIMYSAPEALQFEQNLPLMDMYSMGIVFFQIATLNFPYRVNSSPDPFAAWREAHLFQQPVDPTSINNDLDVELSQMILRMIAKRPDERYQSWDELLERLKHVKNVPANVEDIASLLRQDMDSRRKAEREALESEKKSRVDEEKEGFIRYSFNQVFQAATQIVEQFNNSSDLSKLKIEKHAEFSFAIVKDGSNNSNRIAVEIELAHGMQQFQVQVPGFNTKMPVVKAWGIIKAPSGYGFNIVLVATGQDDLYGEWQVIYKNLTLS